MLKFTANYKYILNLQKMLKYKIEYKNINFIDFNYSNELSKQPVFLR